MFHPSLPTQPMTREAASRTPASRERGDCLANWPVGLRNGEQIMKTLEPVALPLLSLCPSAPLEPGVLFERLEELDWHR